MHLVHAGSSPSCLSNFIFSKQHPIQNPASVSQYSSMHRNAAKFDER